MANKFCIASFTLREAYVDKLASADYLCMRIKNQRPLSGTNLSIATETAASLECTLGSCTVTGMPTNTYITDPKKPHTIQVGGHTIKIDPRLDALNTSAEEQTPANHPGSIFFPEGGKFTLPEDVTDLKFCASLKTERISSFTLNEIPFNWSKIDLTTLPFDPTNIKGNFIKISQDDTSEGAILERSLEKEDSTIISSNTPNQPAANEILENISAIEYEILEFIEWSLETLKERHKCEFSDEVNNTTTQIITTSNSDDSMLNSDDAMLITVLVYLYIFFKNRNAQPNRVVDQERRPLLDEEIPENF